ncbi:hypothetical protein GBA52_015007 [Prunus armeniaca]|nr:hypothetical protein GBA52_015007 [Prunus armeniaca]
MTHVHLQQSPFRSATTTATATAHHRPTTATCRRPSPTNRGLTQLPFIHPKKKEEFVSLKGLEP